MKEITAVPRYVSITNQDHIVTITSVVEGALNLYDATKNLPYLLLYPFKYPDQEGFFCFHEKDVMSFLAPQDQEIVNINGIPYRTLYDLNDPADIRYVPV